jgi:multicomponent K+:H+ antiporter subunit C
MTELLVAAGIGLLTGTGVWLLLRARAFDVALGLTLLSYAVNLFIFCMGRLRVDAAPIVAPDLPPDLAHYTDPLPQALVLTAIVIGFGMTALLLVIALVTREEAGTDHVDGREPPDHTAAGAAASPMRGDRA